MQLYGRGQVSPAQLQCLGFKHDSKTAYSLRIVFGKLNDKHSAAGMVHCKSLLLQLQQRLANGYAADVKQRRKTSLIETLSRLKDARDDGEADALDEEVFGAQSRQFDVRIRSTQFGSVSGAGGRLAAHPQL